MHSTGAPQGPARPADPRAHWFALSQDQREMAYDNNAAAADSARLIDERNARSAVYRDAHNATLDIPYGDAERMAFDLYPAARAEAPCLVFIHGGYWQRNSREMFACFAEGPAAAGWSVALPGYTLAPQKTLTGIVSEIGRALDWLAINGATYGIAGPIILAGWSAGAHLTVLHLDHPSVVAGLAISGIYELAPLRQTQFNAALQLTEEETRKLSPLHLPISSKPLAIAYGTDELATLVLDSCDLFAQRQATGAPGWLLPIEGANHFSILAELQKPAGALVTAAARLLETATPATP